MTAGCGLAANKIGGAKPVVDKFFDGILAKIDHIQVPKDVTVSPKSGSGKAHSDQVEDAQHSTVVNWTGERMKNGGMGSCKAVQENSQYPHLIKGHKETNSLQTRRMSRRRKPGMKFSPLH